MNLSNHAENLIAIWLAGGAAPTVLGTVYLDVHSADPGESNTNNTSVYNTLTGVTGRKLITPTSSFFLAVEGIVTNIAEISLTQSAAAPCTITHFSIWTSNTGGTQIYSGAVTTTINVLVGNNVRFAPNSIQITVA